MIKVKTQKAIPGFLPTTYAVFNGEKLLQIFLHKSDAEKYAAEKSREEENETIYRGIYNRAD